MSYILREVEPHFIGGRLMVLCHKNDITYRIKRVDQPSVMYYDYFIECDETFLSVIKLTIPTIIIIGKE